MIPGDPRAVEQLFDVVAPSYDMLNDLFSFGLHRIWKTRLLDWVCPTKGEYWIDLCCGTGDLSLSLARRVGPSGAVIGLDAAIKPLALAKRRAAKEPWLELSWIQADALETGLPSEEFDGVAMAYGLVSI